MKVLAVSHSAVVGPNRLLYSCMASRCDAEVAVVMPASWPSEYGGPSLRAPMSDGGLTLHPMPVRLAGSIPLHHYVRGVRRLMRDVRPDVLFIDEEPYSVAAAQWCAAAGRVPVVLCTKQNILKRYPVPFRIVERWIHKRVAAIAVVSDEVRDVLQARGYPGPTPLLDFAVDLAAFSPDGPALPHSLSGPVIGYLGRLTEAKGVDLVLEAVAALPGDLASVLLVGAGPAESALRAQAVRLGLESRTRFAGPVDHTEAATALRAMDLLVVPSRTTPTWKEQFGRVIIEAMACGVPVVGSDSGHIPHLIRETGGGEVFPEGDSTALAACLHRLLQDPNRRHELGVAGRNAVTTRYAYERVATALHDLLVVAAAGSGSDGPR